MSEPIRFLLNDRPVSSAAPADTPLLTVLRDEFHLVGTKPGCREGDCGACTVLIGEIASPGLRYLNVVACLTPLGNVQGRHVVTIEGLNRETLSPVQQAMVDHGGQQCGFCTPGFVVSLTGFVMSRGVADAESAVESMDGNICRCTGYSSIIRAAEAVVAELESRPEGNDPIEWAVEAGFLPGYFTHVHEQLARLPIAPYRDNSTDTGGIAGGTDAMVRRRWSAGSGNLTVDSRDSIRIEDNFVVIPAHCTGTDMLHSPELLSALPGLPGYMRLVASTPIRNMGTAAGNLVNASPIGDYTIMLLALGAQLKLIASDGSSREVSLDRFYRGYKQMDLLPGEHVGEIRFRSPGPSAAFHFEKVCKRTHLDIASVNTAILVDVDDGVIQSARLSAGGVAPVPLYLAATSEALSGQPLVEASFVEAGERAQEEISPISDVRGSERYKRLLLRQLLRAHYHELVRCMETAA